MEGEGKMAKSQRERLRAFGFRGYEPLAQIESPIPPSYVVRETSDGRLVGAYFSIRVNSLRTSTVLSY
ncbi:unnamed protein product [Gongylonema pulchrum]|uniref:GCN5-related N-acetyltransferase n=1 Tax=Gongylonema pulchrum TaxID=637853 RepID=A0A183DJZ6_9BILA|nr:unnamed protein product [Gongylonema pulchrum]